MRRTVTRGGRCSPLARLAARAFVLALCALVAAAALPGRPRAEEMMLAEEQRIGSAGYGWLFVGLTLIAAGVAANDYQETEYNVKKAKDAYSNYQAAKDASTALYYRDLTTTYSHRAKSYESTTNAAIVLSLAFAATAVAIFSSSGKEESPLLLSDRGVQWTYRF